MTPRRLSRRTVLRGLGAALSLPLLDLMSPLGRASAPPLNRLAYLYFPNGIPRGTWHPEAVAPDGRLVRLNDWMRPLEPFKDDILIPSNLWTPLGNGHIGEEAFRRMLQDERLRAIPCFIETPDDIEWHGKNLALLKSMARDTD